MCTLSWLFSTDGDGYSLFFNRDELKSRQHALPPELKQSNEAALRPGVTYIAPTDTDAGGTWLAVNEFGVTICILTNYLAPEPKHIDFRSRGEIVAELAVCQSIQEAETLLDDMDLQRFRGFDLVLFDRDVVQWSWDTYRFQRKVPAMPLTSSSHESNRVCEARKEYFSKLSNAESLDVLQSFHSCHLDDNLQPIVGMPVRANSVCMHRENAQTVSQCFVQVNSREVSIRYIDGSPCSNEMGVPLALQRLKVA